MQAQLEDGPVLILFFKLAASPVQSRPPGFQPWFAKPEPLKLGLEKLSLLLEGLCQRAAFGEFLLHLGNLKLGLFPTKLPGHDLEKLPRLRDSQCDTVVVVHDLQLAPFSLRQLWLLFVPGLMMEKTFRGSRIRTSS